MDVKIILLMCMAYTMTQVRNKFLTYIDEDFTGYFDNDVLTRIGQKAVQNWLVQKIAEFQATQKVTEDVRPVVKTVTLTSVSTPPIASGNSVDIANATLAYKELIVALCIYSGSTVQRRAEPQLYTERGSFYSSGITRYPKYRRANNLMYFEPSTTVITSIEFTYFKEPLVADLTDLDFTIASYTLAWPNKAVEEIINEMKLIAYDIIRDQYGAETTIRERIMDKTEQ